MATSSSKRRSICILLDPAHGQEVKGKASPDGKLKEYTWSRAAIKKMVKKLQEDGYRAIQVTESQNEIGLANRVQIARNYSNYFGSQKTVFVSIHVNAAGNGQKWMKAQGWQVHCANSASANSQKLATMLYDEVEAAGLKVRKPTPTQKWWSNDFYVLKHTPCPAVLVESMFMDNHEDCEFLLSAEGTQELVGCYVTAIEKYVDSLAM